MPSIGNPCWSASGPDVALCAFPLHRVHQVMDATIANTRSGEVVYHA